MSYVDRGAREPEQLGTPMSRSWYTTRVHYVRPPAWRYYPQPDRPRTDLRQLIQGMDALAGWLRSTWWSTPKTDTKTITKALEPHLPASGAASGLAGLQHGWNLETREKYPALPFLYAENDQKIQSVRPDGVFVDDCDRLTLLEVEGGGAETNYRGMKDIVEALLLPRVDYVALIVPFRAHKTEPYEYYNNLVASLYAQQVVQPHLQGMLVMGY
jgi:hypothetical protein